MRSLLIALLISTAAGGAAHAQTNDVDRIEANAQSRQMRAERAQVQVAQRGEGRRGGNGGQRAQAPRQRDSSLGGMGRRSMEAGGWRGRQSAAPQAQAAPQQQTQTRGNWNRGDGQRNFNRGDGQRNWNRGDAGAQQRWQGRRNVTPVAPSGSIDRNNDGRVDRAYDRNRNGRLDRNFDRNRDGALDRRFDRNRDGELDRRLDRNNNDRIDRRFDRNRDGRLDNRRWDGNRWNNGGREYNWNRGWRNDRRYDWYGYRNRYRNYFYAPRYYNPYGYGYGYSRFSIGVYLDSLFYSNRYWLNDPGYYRLPAAPYGARWVRYYDDVLLVDIDSGYVIDVIHDFFL